MIDQKIKVFLLCSSLAQFVYICTFSQSTINNLCLCCVSLITAKDKQEKVFAIAYLRLMTDIGTTITNGTHELLVYKVNYKVLQSAWVRVFFLDLFLVGFLRQYVCLSPSPCCRGMAA